MRFPHSRPGDGLLRVHPPREEGVEAPEIHDLARGVDLGLDRRLALSEHGRRVELHPPGSGEQLGRAEENRGGGPPRPKFDHSAQAAREASMAACASAAPAMWQRASACAWSCGIVTSNVFEVRNLASADDQRDFDDLALLAEQLFLEGGRSGQPGA